MKASAKKRRAKKKEPIARLTAQLPVLEWDGETMRFRHVLGSGEYRGQKVETSMCMSGAAIYVQLGGFGGRQFSASLADLAQAMIDAGGPSALDPNVLESGSQKAKGRADLSATDDLVAAIDEGLEPGAELLWRHCTCPISYWEGNERKRCERCCAWKKVTDAMRACQGQKSLRRKEHTALQSLRRWLVTGGAHRPDHGDTVSHLLHDDASAWLAHVGLEERREARGTSANGATAQESDQQPTKGD